MTHQYDFELPLPHGLHARPASILRDAADAHSAAIRIVNRRNGQEANAKSVLSLVALDAQSGDPCTLLVDGEQADAAFAALRSFLVDVLPGCDEPLPAAGAGAPAQKPLPRVIESSGATVLRGTPVSAGLAEAPAFLLSAALAITGIPETTDAPAAEEARLLDAVRGVSAGIEAGLATVHNRTETDILHAHQAIVTDPEMLDRIRADVRAGRSAGKAIVDAQQHYAALLARSESAYLRERALDVRDVCSQLLTRLYTNGQAPQRTGPAGPCVVVAQDLTPSEFLALDRGLLKGLVLAEGGATSHTVILARAAGIPTVIGVHDALAFLNTGQTVLLDAARGAVLPNPPEPVRRYYALDRLREERRAQQLSAYVSAPGCTADGRHIEAAANASTAEEAEAAFAAGAEGIGLFRTEMLFLDREAAPTEEEQYDTYARVVRAAAGRPVIFRTLDVGGDKPAPYLNLPAEANPFLGYRAVRFYEEHRPLVLAQLRALLRAAALGPVRVMVPMVSGVDEVRLVRSMVDEAAAALAGEGAAHGEVEIGIMVEVPAAALLIDRLSEVASFFSIGTNDLAQYLLAVDRGNPKVAGLYAGVHPALLRLMKQVVDQAHAHGRWVGLCGEMGGQERLAPLLVGLGLDEVSMAAPSVPAMKAAFARLRTDECAALVEQALAQDGPADVDKLVTAFTPAAAPRGILDAAITRLDSGARSREEAIKELVDMLSLAGRTADGDAVEEAIWQREDVYSTGVGYGFAIPHCKSKDVLANSIGVMKLREPIEWKTLDGEPVRIVLMLAIRDAEDGGEEHLRIFARLARKIMHEEFRERLLAEEDMSALLAFISESVDA